MTDVTSEQGASIAYDRYGEGPPVIFVGGAFQHRAIDPQTAALARDLAARGFTVIDYDRPGRGETRAEGPYGLQSQLDALRALIDLVGPAALYGSSSGGAISLAAAAHGLPVTKLVLWETPLGPELGSDGVEFLAGLRERIATGDGDAIVTYFMKDMPREWFEMAKAGPMWPVMTSIGPSLEGDSEALAWSQSAPRKELFAAVTVPALVLLGEETMPLFADAADSIATALPDVRSERVAGKEHSWDPAAMIETLDAFLRG